MISRLEEIRETLFKYLETRIDLLKIDVRDKIERAVVVAIYAAALVCIILTIFILLVILLGTFLNKWLESDYLGYVILLGIFVVKLIVWLSCRERLMEWIRHLLLRFGTAKQESDNLPQ